MSYKTKYFSNTAGHYCGPTKIGLYKMDLSWIDVDNKVWSEPTHLYTTAPSSGLSTQPFQGAYLD